MGNIFQTLRKIVGFINNPEENGGLWLPNIQRYFVWKEDQIERLFDSIMREYPIGTLLIWKTKEQIKTRKFIENYRDGINLTDFYIPKNEKKKMLVLDCQQRLQALYIALKGSYNGKELYFNVLSGYEDIDDQKYLFKFLKADNAKINDGWLKLKELVYNSKDTYELTSELIKKIDEGEDKSNIIGRNIAKIFKMLKTSEIVSYQLLDSVDAPDLYELNDIVEVFIRANSGGTPLSKSELMFSLLTASWEDIEEELLEFTNSLNQGGYNFSRDFILKTSLILIGTGAKYDVKKFRNEDNIIKLNKKWEAIKKSISVIRDFLYKNTFIRSDKCLPSYLALIPLIYFHFNFPEKWREKDKKELSFWIIQVSLAGSFSGTPDGLLDTIVKNIEEKEEFDVNSINNIILSKRRTIYLTPETIINAKYGQKRVYLIFNLLYKDIDFSPAFDGNIPTLDHIFPKSLLKKVKIENPKTGRKIMKYPARIQDQIANLMILSSQENCEEKHDTSPEIWFRDKNEEYLRLHLIPQKEYLTIENFEEFIKRRKRLIIKKFIDMNLIQKIQ